MKRTLKNVLFLSAAIAAGTATADWGLDCNPIVGIDYKWSHAKKGNAFRSSRSQNGASVYLGSRFCENFGVELGYDWSGKKTNNFSGTFTEGNRTFTGTTATSARLSLWRLDLNGYLPVGCCENFDLIGSVGIGSSRTRLTFSENGNNTVGAVTTPVNNTASVSRTKAVWRLGVGAQYMVSCNVGVRGMYRYEGLAGQRYVSPISSNVARAAKHASSFTLGLFYQF